MKKTIRNVFLVIGVLVLCLLLWAVFFNGSLQAAWNAVAGQINTGWNAVAGDGTKVVDDWDDLNPGGNANVADQASNAGGVEIH